MINMLDLTIAMQENLEYTGALSQGLSDLCVTGGFMNDVCWEEMVLDVTGMGDVLTTLEIGGW